MKNKKLLLSLLTATLLLWGCNNAETPIENDVQETETQALTEICLFENGTPIYTIVRPDVKSDAISAAVSLAANTLYDNFDCELGIINDWVADPSEIPVGTPEILLGATNRPESAEVMASLGDNLYHITCVNNRIVIAASSESALVQATQAFCDTIVADESGRILVPANLDITLSLEDAWPLVGIPYYAGGSININTVACETGFASPENPSLVLGITNTTADEFAAYIEKVQNAGFTVTMQADWQGVKAYQCDTDDISFYTYYTAGTNEVRIIHENSTSVSLEQFNNPFDVQEGATNDIYLYGIYTSDPNNPKTEGYNNNGQLLVMKLADNSLFVIDGGRNNQVNSDNLLEFLREITGTSENETIRIACWFITHPHKDHYQGFNNFIKAHSDKIVIERLLYNFKAGTTLEFDLSEFYPDILYHKPKTGEILEFGNVTMDVLYSQEDAIILDTMTYFEGEGDINNTSVVLRIQFDGKTCLILGDIDKDASQIIQKYHTDEELKADVVQIAHHGYNPLHTLYDKIDAKIALFPNSYGNAQLYGNILTTIQSTCDELYFGGNETAGVRVIDGEVQAFFRRETIYE